MAGADSSEEPRSNEDRAPEGPSDLKREPWGKVLKRTIAAFRKNNLTVWAAALTYYGVLSIFPALLALVSVLGLIGKSATQPLINNLSSVASGPAKQIITSAIQNLQSGRGGAGALFIVSLAAALWAASGYVAAFMQGSNVIYDVGEGRPIWKTLPTRLLTTLVLLLLLAVAAVGVTFTGGLATQAGKLLGVGSSAVTIWDIAKWPVILAIVLTMLSILYWASPNVKHPRFRWVSAGGILGVGVSIIASAGFALYVRQLLLLQQDLRRLRRSDRLPRLAVDLEHRDPARRGVQRRARTRTPDPSRTPRQRRAIPRAARHPQAIRITAWRRAHVALKRPHLADRSATQAAATYRSEP